MRGYAEVLVILAFLFLLFAVLIGLPAVGLWWFAKWLQRRQYRRSAVAMQILLVGFGLFCSSVVYSFYVPSDSEIEHEFVQLTGLPFPESGEVVDGEISGLDLGGDYFINAEIVVDKDDYERVLSSIRTNATFHTEIFITDTAYIKRVHSAATKRLARFNALAFSKDDESRGKYQSINFLPDQRTVTFHCSQN